MVAAWIRADTGVGPAMASGSQTCSGNCADFPIAPPNSRSADTVSSPANSIDAFPSTCNDNADPISSPNGKPL